MDEAAYVKAAFLTDVAKSNTACALVSRVEATRLLGTMLGGYNIPPLVELLDDAEVGKHPQKRSKSTLLCLMHFMMSKKGAKQAIHWLKKVESWANEWFLNKPEVPVEIKVTV